MSFRRGSAEEEGEEVMGAEGVPAYASELADAFACKLREMEALHYAAELDTLAGMRCVQLYAEVLTGLTALGRMRWTTNGGDTRHVE
ncbi:hypothetical protein BCY84_07929 [Trypanosoma cruzi cruzi]|nr:hypothetical protein TcBrA4_0138300 [Trypanosoma cruzi]PBJ76771.1 hypothetical protein BCY84_07929 [Trypanosoma cruzi cruzi]